MGKIWKRTRKDAKRFAREAKLGKPYYVLREVAQNIAPYEDSHLWSEIVFDWRSPITRTPMYSSISAEGLVLREGPVYEDLADLPVKCRGLHEAPPQVRAPFGGGKNAHNRSLARDAYRNLVEDEIKAEAAEQRGKQKAKSSWW